MTFLPSSGLGLAAIVVGLSLVALHLLSGEGEVNVGVLGWDFVDVI